MSIQRKHTYTRAQHTYVYTLTFTIAIFWWTGIIKVVNYLHTCILMLSIHVFSCIHTYVTHKGLYVFVRIKTQTNAQKTIQSRHIHIYQQKSGGQHTIFGNEHTTIIHKHLYQQHIHIYLHIHDKNTQTRT